MPRQQRRTAYTKPLDDLLKRQLVQLAIDFDLPSGGSVTNLRTILKAHLDEYRDALANDPVYQKLYSRCTPARRLHASPDRLLSYSNWGGIDQNKLRPASQDSRAPSPLLQSSRYHSVNSNHGKQLASVLNEAEQCNTEIRAGNANVFELPTTQSQIVAPSLIDNADVVKIGDIFSNAHDLVVTGGTYYSGHIVIQHAPSQDSYTQGIVPGVRVIAFEDISINREIYKNQLYRIYSDNSSGSARVVKVYQGPGAKERAQEAASSIGKLCLEGSLESSITKALEKDLNKSIILGIRTVIGLTSGLDYLRDVDYPFKSARSDHFRAFLDLEGEVIVSFDPDIAREHSEVNAYDELSSLSKVDQSLRIFHELCEQTFDRACQAHYDRQQVKRTYHDALDTWRLYKDLPETNPPSAVLSAGVSSKKYPEKLSINGHRRELVWKPENGKKSSLEGICLEFKAFLNDFSGSSVPALHYLNGGYPVRTAHRCPGYKRTEITLTTSIARSAIVSHSTPLPHEICPVCSEIVKDAEVFNCVCGEEDNESVPTIRCSSCYQWHHCHCVGDVTGECFTCRKCRRIPGSEFNDAMRYFNRIKARYQEDPNRYKQFLDILQTHQKEGRVGASSQINIQIQTLFKDAPELIVEFKEFNIS